MSDNKREERAPMVSQAMENVRASGALSRRPGARRRWTLAPSEESDNARSAESAESSASADPESGSSAENQDEGAAGTGDS